MLKTELEQRKMSMRQLSIYNERLTVCEEQKQTQKQWLYSECTIELMSTGLSKIFVKLQHSFNHN